MSQPKIDNKMIDEAIVGNAVHVSREPGCRPVALPCLDDFLPDFLEQFRRRRLIQPLAKIVSIERALVARIKGFERRDVAFAIPAHQFPVVELPRHDRQHKPARQAREPRDQRRACRSCFGVERLSARRTRLTNSLR